MSKLNRRKLQKMILSEMRMIGMANLGPISPMKSLADDNEGYNYTGDLSDLSPTDAFGLGRTTMEDELHEPVATGISRGNVSKEDCCEAVMALIECCSCPITKQKIVECCEELLAGNYDI